MDKLKMHTPNLADENFKKLAAMFPNAITETITGYGEDGKPIIERAIDADVLRQEISAQVVEGAQERYQFTWPDKKKSVVLANAPIAKTLRLDREKSVGRDGTEGCIDSENIYIEGDNLDALKLLQETYLGKVKMIYIDPPYNTGNDFIYEDDFAQEAGEYLDNSGQFDDEGNRLVQNTESNGRFHTDWLNMIYPRLRIAKDFLSDDGVIFISIDDNEQENMKKCCDEIFGKSNFVATFPWRKRTAKSDVPFGVSQDYEWIICYARSEKFVAATLGTERKYFETPDCPNRPWRIHDLTKQTTASDRPNSFFTITNPKTAEEYPANPNRTWAITKESFNEYYLQGKIVFPGDYDFLNITKPAFRYWKEDDMNKAGDMFGLMPVSTKLLDCVGMSLDGTKEITELMNGKIFSFPKTVKLIKYFVDISTKTKKDSIILDFFSGSATTAHAVMQLNAEDGGNRKFIMVQLPEETDEKSEAYKAGYKTICEIGEERIRRAGKKIKEETGADIDYGFRVFRVDSSNMKDVYYRPAEYTQEQLSLYADNIKPDRTPEDLLFQVMLDLGVLLSSKIDEEEIAGKKVFSVENGYLIACFDNNVTEETVIEIAKRHPFYAVFRDSGLASDSVAVNFEQIFETYSPKTQRKVL
ncbi:MAG: site-specific DNA-methyltransferase [Lachnospiraceae bacterium]|nr:site-specific DNA-methyltransferase [Lachnospiraceae bacterium]MDE7200479.1 site-specific DNA-methyltransferase [Lachnospiraceae bacterium]